MRKHTPLKRPNASFMLHAQDFVISTLALSAYETGRLFMRALKAVDERDEQAIAKFSFIGRVYSGVNGNQRPGIPPSVRRAVFDKFGRLCVECGSDYKPEIDHFIPYSKCQTHEFENLRVLCKPCNRRKGASMPVVQ